MEDPSVTEYFTLSVRRYDDGTVRLYAGVDAQAQTINPWTTRVYRQPSDIGDVVDDAARLLCGWGALGQWGFIDAGDRLRQLDRY